MPPEKAGAQTVENEPRPVAGDPEAVADEPKASILVVDDEPYVAELVRRWLDADGYRVHTASCADQACERLLLESYQLVITDITMPGATGIDLLRDIRNRYGDSVAVIMATALSDRELVTESLRAGAYGYTVKPLDRGELSIHVAAALERRRLTLRSLAWQQELEDEVNRQTESIRRREREIAWRLICAADSRDDVTGAHIQRIGRYAQELALAAGWSERAADELVLAAAMHDIGKIGIPDGILRKPGALTVEERAIMERHTTLGAEILRGSNVPLLQTAAVIARSHHERWDGDGYPDGLSGNDIPEAARIVSVVDVYDALRSDRPYRPKMSIEDAVQEMRRMQKGHFDPRLYRLFEQIFERIVALETETHERLLAG